MESLPNRIIINIFLRISKKIIIDTLIDKLSMMAKKIKISRSHRHSHRQSVHVKGANNTKYA